MRCDLRGSGGELDMTMLKGELGASVIVLVWWLSTCR